jgi:hypothetical protein
VNNHSSAITSGHIIRFALTLLVLLVPLTSHYGHASSSSKPLMPEVYISPRQSYCTIRIRVPGSTIAQRRATIIGLLANLYQKSHGWKERYVPIDVDFTDYMSLGLVIFATCKSLGSIEAAIADVNSVTPVLAYNIVSRSPYVASGDVLYQLPSPVDRFKSLNPRADIKSCMIVLDVRLPDKYTSLSQMNDEITRIQMKYRFPFAGVNSLNKRIFIVLARNCDRKMDLYTQLVYALSREGTDLSRYARVETAPNIADYLRAQPHVVR